MSGHRPVQIDKDFKNKASVTFVLSKLRDSISTEGYAKLLIFSQQEKQAMVYSYVPKGGAQ